MAECFGGAVSSGPFSVTSHTVGTIAAGVNLGKYPRRAGANHRCWVTLPGASETARGQSLHGTVVAIGTHTGEQGGECGRRWEHTDTLQAKAKSFAEGVSGTP